MLLSICIPTHDGRAETLRETLDSLAPQVTAELAGVVEVCISDNGSVDRTQRLIADFAAAHAGMVVAHRFDENVGGRKNFLKAVEIASGRFVWFVGSDDIVEPSAVATILGLISKNRDVPGFYVNRTRFDSSMVSEIAENPKDRPGRPAATTTFRSADELLSRLALYQNYMSSVVFRRDEWLRIVEAEGVERVISYRHYTHSYIWCRMTVANPNWTWYPVPAIRQRMDNDSFIALGGSKATYVAEMLEDIRRQMRDTVGFRSRAYWITMRKMFDIWCHSAVIVAWRSSPELTASADSAMRRSFVAAWFFLPQFWLRTFPALAVPRRLAAPIAGVIRRIAMAVAVRSRLRAILAAIGVRNAWTDRHDRRRDDEARVTETRDGPPAA